MINSIILGFMNNYISTSKGRTKLEDIHKNLKLSEAHKTAEKCKDGNIHKENFAKLASNVLEMNELTDIGIRFGTGVAINLIKNGVNSLLNNKNEKIPLVSNNSTGNLGELANYYKHNVHIGLPTTERIRKHVSLPTIEYEEKTLSIPSIISN